MCAAFSDRPDQRLPRDARLRKRSEFLEVQGSRCRFVTPHFIFFGKVKKTSNRRLGVTASKKVGNAVVRNAVKRSVREAFRRYQHEIPLGLDLVAVARPTAKGVSCGHTEKELRDFVRHVKRKLES